jgi:hypothetical protein
MLYLARRNGGKHGESAMASAAQSANEGDRQADSNSGRYARERLALAALAEADRAMLCEPA